MVELSKKFILLYYRLQVIGIEGKLGIPLEKVSELCNGLNLEFAPVKKEVEGDFLAAFCFKPVIDIALDKIGDNSSIVTYSLDENASEKIRDEIIKNIGLVPSAFDTSLIETITHELEFEKKTYDYCRVIATTLATDMDSIFGMVRYTNFLQRYKGLSKEESAEKVVAKFNLEEAMKRYLSTE